MAEYIPPTENLSTFDTLMFRSANDGITIAEGDTRYLRFPVSQGSETISGNLTITGEGLCSTVPSGNTSLTNKLYVDTAVVGGSILGLNNTFTGINTFTNNTITSTFSAGASTLASATVTGALGAGSISTVGTLSAGASTLASATVTGALGANTATITGALGAGSISTVGTLSAGASTLASATITGALGANTATITGALGAGSISTVGTLSAGASTLASATVTGALGANTATITNALGAGSISTVGTLSAGASTLTSVITDTTTGTAVGTAVSVYDEGTRSGAITLGTGATGKTITIGESSASTVNLRGSTIDANKLNVSGTLTAGTFAPTSLTTDTIQGTAVGTAVSLYNENLRTGQIDMGTGTSTKTINIGGFNTNLALQGTLITAPQFSVGSGSGSLDAGVSTLSSVITNTQIGTAVAGAVTLYNEVTRTGAIDIGALGTSTKTITIGNDTATTTALKGSTITASKMAIAGVLSAGASTLASATVTGALGANTATITNALGAGSISTVGTLSAGTSTLTSVITNDITGTAVGTAVSLFSESSRTANTNIGNGSSRTGIINIGCGTSSTNVVNIGRSGGGVQIGQSGSTNSIDGTTNFDNGTHTVYGTTNINTTGSNTTTIGNASASTAIDGALGVTGLSTLTGGFTSSASSSMNHNFLIQQSTYPPSSTSALGYTGTVTVAVSTLPATIGQEGTWNLPSKGVWLICCTVTFSTNSAADTNFFQAVISLTSASATEASAGLSYYEEDDQIVGGSGTRDKINLTGVVTVTAATALYFNAAGTTSGSAPSSGAAITYTRIG